MLKSDKTQSHPKETVTPGLSLHQLALFTQPFSKSHHRVPNLDHSTFIRHHLYTLYHFIQLASQTRTLHYTQRK